MKTTMKAVLTDLTNEQKTLLDHMMLVFCTAIRYSFKRQLEGQVIGDLEKVVAHKYNLNIRQAKDAVESARQTIVSQHELVKQAVDTVITKHCGIAAADLKFKDDSDVSSKLARVSSQFVYSTLLTILERNCRRNGVEFVKVKPQYTSKIGLYKYCHQYGLDVHNGAALVIARRSYGLKETVPKLLREKLVSKKNLTPFNQTNEWGQWSEISKQVNKLFKKGKEVNTPGLWLVRRKLLLGIA